MEFALVLPVLMLLLLGIVDFGKAYTMWTDETHLANQAARYAAVNRGPDGNQVEDDIDAFQLQMEQQADTVELKDTIEITLCFPPATGGGVIGDKGQAVRIDVDAEHDLMPLIGQIPGMPNPIHLRAHSIMRIEGAYTEPFASSHACGP